MGTCGNMLERLRVRNTDQSVSIPQQGFSTWLQTQHPGEGPRPGHDMNHKDSHFRGWFGRLLKTIYPFNCHLPFIIGCHYFPFIFLQIQFSVHIFGSYNGTILFSVQEETGGVSISSLVWERTGSWSDRWFLITLQMPVLQNR